MRELSILAASAMLLAACDRVAEPTGSTVVFQDVTVLTMNSARALPHHSVVVRDDSIVRLGPAAEIEPPRGALMIPGEGRYLIPGLSDMHVHIDHPSELALYPAYGVTSVLNMRGLPAHLEWRRQIADGERFGPTLYTTGDYTDGYPPSMQPMMSFDSPEDAARSVADQKAAGYDFVKVYTRLLPEQLRAVGEAAREADIAVVGHSSYNYDLATLIDAGQVNIAHGEELVRYFDGEDEEDFISTTGATLEDTGVSVTLNLAGRRALIQMWEDLDGLLDRPESGYLHPAILQPFRPANNRYARRDEAWVERVRNALAILHKVTRDLHARGVPLLAGTDASTAGSFPGLSLWQELDELVTVGLTPNEALRTATVEPGRFIGEHLDPSEKFGRVREGFRADLLLLEADPLERIDNVRRIAGVMLRGRWHPAPDLERRLSERAASFAALGERVEELEQLVYSGEIEAARELFDSVRTTRPGEMLFAQYPFFFVGYRFLYGEDGFNPDPRQREIALELYRLYADAYPDRHSSHYQLGQALLANGDETEAVESFRRALEIHPYYPDARKALAGLEPTEE